MLLDFGDGNGEGDTSLLDLCIEGECVCAGDVGGCDMDLHSFAVSTLLLLLLFVEGRMTTFFVFVDLVGFDDFALVVFRCCLFD